jgi:aminoglycoside N3'-acetyltransferase
MNKDGIQSSRTEVSRADLVGQLRALGVKPGGVLLVHTSFSAVKPVEGGPRGLIAALLDAVTERGTVVMPSWSGNDNEPFDPRSSPASEDLGIVADLFWHVPGVLRSDHPFAFAARGPHAVQITSGDLPLPPHILDSPVGRVYEFDGQILLLGVGHDANTTLHLVETIAAVPYGIPKHCTVIEDGLAVRKDYVENDHCCRRFALAGEWLRTRGLQSEGTVGHAAARLVRSRDVAAVALEYLARDPFIFLHGPSDGCVECDLARRRVPPAGPVKAQR